MDKLLPKILLIIFGVFLIGNLLLLDYWVFLKKESLHLQGVPQAQPHPGGGLSEVGDTTSEATSDPGSNEISDPGSFECGQECQTMITQEVSQAMATISGEKIVTEKVTEKTVEKVIQPTTAPQTLYLPLGSGSSTTATSWVDVSGSDFIFDLADYGSQSEVYWQGNLKAEHSNSRCYARIYDLNNLRAVDFSEQTTDQTSFQTLTSLKLSIWQGKNNYRLQIKSLNGITCFLESPRLIIISK